MYSLSSRSVSSCSCCVLAKRSGTAPLPFVVVRPFSLEAVSFPRLVQASHLLACPPSHLRHSLVSSGVLFYPSRPCVSFLSVLFSSFLFYSPFASASVPGFLASWMRE